MGGMEKMQQMRKYTFDPPKVLVLGFALIIVLGAMLLTLPIATNDGQGLPWLDALFTATSATCVTGLVVVDTGTTFTLFGQLVILFLIQIGGLGFMTFATFFAFLVGKRISLKERLLLQEALNNLSIEGIVRLVKRVLVFTVVIEVIGGLLLTIRFSFDMPLLKAFYFGMFHAISNFNNAGFDLMGEFRSLTGYVEDPIVTLVVCALITLGGIGFIVMNEIYEYRQVRRFSLHTKIVFVTSGLLAYLVRCLFFYWSFTIRKHCSPSLRSEKF